jgi:hypothetical protein
VYSGACSKKPGYPGYPVIGVFACKGRCFLRFVKWNGIRHHK